MENTRRRSKPTIVGAGSVGAIEVCRDSDVIVVTAGTKQKLGQIRLDLAGVNVAMTLDLTPALPVPGPRRTTARRRV